MRKADAAASEFVSRSRTRSREACDHTGYARIGLTWTAVAASEAAR